MKKKVILALLAMGMSLAACTAEQAYYAGQEWQRNQCSKVPDKTESDRCMGNADTSYDSYKRRTGTEGK